MKENIKIEQAEGTQTASVSGVKSEQTAHNPAWVKLLAFFALVLIVMGTVWAFVCVIKAEDSAFPAIGLGLLTVSAVPTIIWLAKQLTK